MRGAVATLMLLALSCCGGVAPAARTAGAEAADAAIAMVTSPAAEKALEGLAAGAASAAASSAVAAVNAGIPKVASRVREEVFATADDPRALAAVDALRERAVGAPLRADVDALIAEAAPRLSAAVASSVAAALAPVDASARRDAGYLRDVAIGLAIAAVALLVALAFAIWELRRHRHLLGAMLGTLPAGARPRPKS